MIDEAWDFIFFADKPLPESLKEKSDILNKMRNEFQYWYPVDLRVSGKENLKPLYKIIKRISVCINHKPIG